MTTTLSKGATTSITLSPGEQLTVTAAAFSAGSVWPFSERLGDTAGVSELAAGASVLLGPFATVKRYQIAATLGSLTYDAAPVDFPTAAEALVAALAAALAALPAVHGTVGDLCEYIGAGAPVDGAAGTGFGVAGIGSRYTDTTAGKMYINGGTKTVPVWKLVTSAA